MPQYLTIYTPAAPANGPPSPEHMAAMGELIGKMNARGALVAMGATVPGSFKVSLADGTCTTGELPKTGESGFAILAAKDREDALQMVREFLAVAGDGESVVHPLMGPPPQG
ncbi:MAG TPA: hypothetical protein VGB91_09140 [Rhizomicrobium sp.]